MLQEEPLDSYGCWWVTCGFITWLSRGKVSCHRHEHPPPTGTGSWWQLGVPSSAGRALFFPYITSLPCLLESAQAVSFSLLIAAFGLDVQIAELNRDKGVTLYKLPWI